MKIISFEGIEGVGKSTQIDLLYEYLLKMGKSVEKFREPGSTIPSEKIRNILLDADLTLSSQTELLLMYASRSELVVNEIESAECDFILLDRYFDASMAYQGYGRDLDKKFINSLKTFINAPDPDLTILLDIDPVKGFERKSGDSMDRIESSGLKFFNDVRDGYLELADKYSRIKCIDAEKDAKAISKEIIYLVESL
ncbi:MAG: dTMP kinase [Flavobacteriaceae bacterium]|nr:dTMP kinase [Flavobacteriaceae bacterium]|tara:strand:+ start:265 stop:855 length:591 start_codon:yes stop_codon:yes gene_type:complete